MDWYIFQKVALLKTDLEALQKVSKEKADALNSKIQKFEETIHLRDEAIESLERELLSKDSHIQDLSGEIEAFLMKKGELDSTFEKLKQRESECDILKSTLDEMKISQSECFNQLSELSNLARGMLEKPLEVENGDIFNDQCDDFTSFQFALKEISTIFQEFIAKRQSEVLEVQVPLMTYYERIKQNKNMIRKKHFLIIE